jgi:hypothetical protein
MSVVRRGARCGGRTCCGDVAACPEAQAVMVCRARRPTPVVDSKVIPPGPSRSKPQTPRAERRRVRLSCGDVLMCLFFTNAHGAVGVAKRPAFRAPSSGGPKEQRRGRTRRRPNNTGGEALANPSLLVAATLSFAATALSAVVPAQAGTQHNLRPHPELAMRSKALEGWPRAPIVPPMLRDDRRASPGVISSA